MSPSFGTSTGMNSTEPKGMGLPLYVTFPWTLARSDTFAPQPATASPVTAATTTNCRKKRIPVGSPGPKAADLAAIDAHNRGPSHPWQYRPDTRDHRPPP